MTIDPKVVQLRETQVQLLALLRAPFPANQISQLPKGGTTLSYVGHAALTDRLLEVDPFWTWEPMALTPQGLPLFDESGGLWIRLTICGHTRLGYGHAAKKAPGDREKEIIGDALRNAAMRFGAALDLWHKGGDLHADDDVEREAIQDEGRPLARTIASTQDGAVSPPGAQARFSELCKMLRDVKTEAEIKEIELTIKAEWADLKDLAGAREGFAGARNAALQRVK
jgi:hypothetical protein